MARKDLAARLARITRRLAAAERPVLDRHGLSMWQYIVLSHLAQEPAPTQLALAQAIGYDKTRLIVLLDDLERRTLIVRAPDPNDRRARIIALTQAGAQLNAAAQRDIQAIEDQLLSALQITERHALQTALSRLDERPPSGRRTDDASPGGCERGMPPR